MKRRKKIQIIFQNQVPGNNDYSFAENAQLFSNCHHITEIYEIILYCVVVVVCVTTESKKKRKKKPKHVYKM